MPTKILLREDEIPRRWYNVLADLPRPLPPVYSPRTMKPVEPQELLALFPGSLLEQEMSAERWISIPEEVLNIYSLWRPTPLFRARRLEEALGVRSHVYYKYEGVSPAGSHKPNTAIPQAYYNKKDGIRRLTTETGAGQWGSALSLACNYFGLACTVFMVRVSYQQKPYRRALMETWGAEVHASPSDKTQAGRSYIEKDANHPGSLGIAISEAVEDAATHDDTHYALGSVLNHVCLHQTVIGLETKRQLEIAGENPDVLIGCCGGGSNFSGLALPFVPEKLAGKPIRMIAVEPASCPTLTKGVYAYDYGDSTRLGPIAKMYTLGHDFVPPGIHAGGLRYHGDSPIVSQLVKDGTVEALALAQTEVFQGAILFARTEGIVPAPESAHAIQAAIREAKTAEKEGVPKTIVFNLSGHGHFDMAAYSSFLGGKLEDFDYPEAKVREAMRNLPQIADAP